MKRNIGIIKYLEYLMLSFKFMALTNGITVRLSDLWSILANNSSDLFLFSARSIKLYNLSSISLKCLPINSDACL
ncbi:hypothetical protein GCM10007383_30130 [Arenibacter certesii]|uniref:Uncharacterized protein n=1 Tax=Arenibacter certesii TaxID=228955 RepID=A0A918J476_9FLAO|nr:hypothetical protein GCM10007383_30130 [Arenibacter certesii]